MRLRKPDHARPRGARLHPVRAAMLPRLRRLPRIRHVLRPMCRRATGPRDDRSIGLARTSRTAARLRIPTAGCQLGRRQLAVARALRGQIAPHQHDARDRRACRSSTGRRPSGRAAAARPASRRQARWSKTRPIVRCGCQAWLSRSKPRRSNAASTWACSCARPKAPPPRRRSTGCAAARGREGAETVQGDGERALRRPPPRRRRPRPRRAARRSARRET